MRGKKVLVQLVPVLVLSMLLTVPMAIAIGPEQAAEVGNNPNLSTNEQGHPILDTPSGVHNFWTSVFNHWISASKGGGKMNNAVIVGLGPTAPHPNLGYLMTHTSEYENTWIYFSQTVFKYFLIYVQDFTEEEATNTAALYPDGIYWNFVTVG